jgi:hypothetical protein
MTWLAQAEALRQSAPQLPVEALENYWRQRGWTALRLLELGAAASALRVSLALIDGNPAAFSALRRAEAELLLAEVALLQGDPGGAQSAVDLAMPAYHAEYPEGHAERVQMLLLQARIALAKGAAAVALEHLDSAAPVLREWQQAPLRSSEREEVEIARALRGQAQAQLGDCAPATAWRAQPAPSLIAHRRRVWQGAAERVDYFCAGAPADSSTRLRSD